MTGRGIDPSDDPPVAAPGAIALDATSAAPLAKADLTPDAAPGDMLLMATSCAPLATPADEPDADPPTMLLAANKLAPGAAAAPVVADGDVTPIGATPIGESPIMVYGAAAIAILVNAIDAPELASLYA